MFSNLKQSLVALLIAALLAPGFYFGMAPAKQADALALDGVISSVVSGGFAYALCEYGSFLQEALHDLLGGVIGSFFSGGLVTAAGSILSSIDSVPTKETNKALLQDVSSTARGTESVVNKECVLDPIAWIIKAILINTITQDIMDWVNSGFYDGPVFLRDPIAFVQDLSEAALNEFLDNSGVDNELCTPFANDIVDMVRDFATEPTYGSNGWASCNFGGYLSNESNYRSMVEDGDILVSGGLKAASELILEGNNPFSAMFNLQAETSARANALVAQQMKRLDYGDGYFSMDCSFNGKDGVCTPGELVSRQIDDWLGGALSELETADEAAEILDAALSAMMYEIFSDSATDGLLEGSRYDDDVDPLSGEGFTSDPPSTTSASSGGGGGGFLWKPVSESTGDLVVLLPSSLGASCSVTANGIGLQFSGVANGDRAHYRYGEPGCWFGTNVSVSASCPDGSHSWTVPDGCSRYE